MAIEIIQLDGRRTGGQRIADRVAAERDRVESFNRNMIAAGKLWRTSMWKGTHLVNATNDETVYEHAFTGERLRGRELSDTGFVPAHWTRVTPYTEVPRTTI